jgi:maltooligosyltrehalose trehalohydrolase
MNPTAYLGSGRCRLAVWAPFAQTVSAAFVSGRRRQISLERVEKEYWQATADAEPGERYFFRLDDNVQRPDPESNYQPLGVHGPSEIVDHASFAWTDADWKGVAQDRLIFYELHVGTFTPEGTFEAILGRLDELKDLGITAVELMPVAQFPGDRNWGYDGVCPWAVQNSYGGPTGLKTLVNACHAAGLAVVLDVVYNHFGPEGNYLHDFGPYFTHKYNTPWGDAVNFDDACSDPVRSYFIRNALFWFEHYHIDALRLDALHQVYDMSAHHFLWELADAVDRFSRRTGRRRLLIGECDLNDTRLVLPPERGGYGLNALWCDDFHHALHVMLTGEQSGYYQDFGGIEDMAKSIREGYVYSGVYSNFRKRRFGRSSKDIPGRQFVFFSQNHDQIGNRMMGDRLSAMIDFEARKLEAAVLLLSPCLPLLFMGQEYGETAPFLYFVSFGDEALIESIRQGRQKEFEAFHTGAEAPDPQAQDTFKKSKLDWSRRYGNPLTDFYKELIRIRTAYPAMANPDKDSQDVLIPDGQNMIVTIRRYEANEMICLFHFAKEDCAFEFNVPDGKWRLVLDSADGQWHGDGGLLAKQIDRQTSLRMRKLSAAVYERVDGAN